MEEKKKLKSIEELQIGKAVREITLTLFIQMLEDHDWHYEYSDDPSVWRKGSNERVAIINAARTLGANAISLIRAKAPDAVYAKQIEEALLS